MYTVNNIIQPRFFSPLKKMFEGGQGERKKTKHQNKLFREPVEFLLLQV